MDDRLAKETDPVRLNATENSLTRTTFAKHMAALRVAAPALFMTFRADALGAQNANGLEKERGRIAGYDARETARRGQKAHG